MSYETILYSFEYFYHMDKANAAIHCSPVKFSPIVFRLAEALQEQAPGLKSAALAEVKMHIDKYEMDMGR